MRDHLEQIGRDYIRETFIPILSENRIDLGGLDLVIGGSVSTGFADARSDIDVYLLFDEGRRDEVLRARAHMFMPVRAEGAALQIVPTPAGSIGLLASGDIPPALPTELIYDAVHYIPITEPTDRLSQAMQVAMHPPAAFWEARLERRVGSLIDLVDAFNRGVARNDLETSWMMCAPVVEGLLQTSLLAANQLHPIAKWLIPECRRSQTAAVRELARKVALPGDRLSCESLAEVVKACLRHVCEQLRASTSMHPDFIADLESPDRHHLLQR